MYGSLEGTISYFADLKDTFEDIVIKFLQYWVTVGGISCILHQRGIKEDIHTALAPNNLFVDKLQMVVFTTVLQ